MTDTELIEEYYSKAVKYVADMPRTKKEVTDRLKKYLVARNLSDDRITRVVEAVIENLVDAKFIDDVTYAVDFVKTINYSSKPRGALYIKRFLIKKGVDSHVISEALTHLNSDKELEGALLLAEKKLKTLKTKNAYQNKQKLWMHLTSRGFGSDTISCVIDSLLGVK